MLRRREIRYRGCFQRSPSLGRRIFDRQLLWDIETRLPLVVWLVLVVEITERGKRLTVGVLLSRVVGGVGALRMSWILT